MWLVTDLGLLIRGVPRPLDALHLPVSLCIGRPEGDLEHMIGFLEQVLGNAETVKDLDGPRLHAVGLANLERAIAALENLVVDAEASEPYCGAQPSRAAAADEDVDFLGFGGHGVVESCGEVTGIYAAVCVSGYLR
jgi:hypothetical protein